MIKGEFKDVKGNTVRGNLGWLLKSIQGWSLHYKLTWICIIRQEEKKRRSKTSSYNNRASVLKNLKNITNYRQTSPLTMKVKKDNSYTLYMRQLTLCTNPPPPHPPCLHLCPMTDAPHKLSIKTTKHKSFFSTGCCVHTNVMTLWNQVAPCTTDAHNHPVIVMKYYIHTPTIFNFSSTFKLNFNFRRCIDILCYLLTIHAITLFPNG